MNNGWVMCEQWYSESRNEVKRRESGLFLYGKGYKFRATSVRSVIWIDVSERYLGTNPPCHKESCWFMAVVVDATIVDRVM